MALAFFKKKISMENCRVFFNTDHRESIFVNQPKMYSFFKEIDDNNTETK
jgi:hypothetical protein